MTPEERYQALEEIEVAIASARAWISSINRTQNFYGAAPISPLEELLDHAAAKARELRLEDE